MLSGRHTCAKSTLGKFLGKWMYGVIIFQIWQVKNEKARRFLSSMRRKPGVPFEQFFPKADRGALRLLKRMLAFDPAERPTSEAALADPYFDGLASLAREPTSGQISKLAFDFERRKLMVDEVCGMRPMDGLRNSQVISINFGLSPKIRGHCGLWDNGENCCKVHVLASVGY